MAKITWADRTDFKDPIGALYEAAANIYNTLKVSVNALYSDKKTWYVSSAGSDSNIGSTAAEPFENISAAIAVYSAGDIIEILEEDYSSNENITISKKTIIKGPVANISGGAAFTQLQGTWTISGASRSVIFENLTTKINWASSEVFNLDVINGAIGSASTFPSRLTNLIIHSSFYSLGASSELRSFECQSCIGLASSLQIGRSFLLDRTSHEGSITSGVDVSQTNTLRNSSIDTNLTITGNLTQENSTIGGTRTVSGTTTEISQAGDKLDRLSASDQSVVSKVIVDNELGSDGMAVGSGFSGVTEAGDGNLIVENEIGLGTEIPTNIFDVVNATGTFAKGITIRDNGDGKGSGIEIHRGGAQIGGYNTDSNEATFFSAIGKILRFSTNAAFNERMRIDVIGNVAIGTTTSSGAKLTVDQSSLTAAIPVITLGQADISEEMIKFETTIGVGNAIEAKGAKTFTETHFIKVTLPGGLTRYIPCGTIV